MPPAEKGASVSWGQLHLPQASGQPGCLCTSNTSPGPYVSVGVDLPEHEGVRCGSCPLKAISQDGTGEEASAWFPEAPQGILPDLGPWWSPAHTRSWFHSTLSGRCPSPPLSLQSTAPAPSFQCTGMKLSPCAVPPSDWHIVGTQQMFERIIAEIH